MNTYGKKVCGVLTANSDFKIFTISRCPLTIGADNYHTKTKNCTEMPNSCLAMYIFHTDTLTYLPIQ